MAVDALTLHMHNRRRRNYSQTVHCGSRKLDLRALGYSTTRFSDPAHSACAVVRGAVIRRDPTWAEETLLSLNSLWRRDPRGPRRRNGPSMNPQ
jgi:hypothetical protein